jgi:hypothetical protein
MVDHLNRPVPASELKKAYAPAAQGYAASSQVLSFAESRSSAAAWLAEQLR